MAKLKCDVGTCTYNSECCCCKGDITVGGKNADCCKQTECDSYRKSLGDGYKSSVSHPSEIVDIDCEVENCFYNNGYKCSAKTVRISGCKACDCTETTCSTFKQK